MLSACALAEKSADMPSRISLWVALPAVLSFAEAGSPRSAAASKRASVSIRLERSQVCASSTTYPFSQREVPKRQPAPTLARHLICAARTLALRTFVPTARRPDRTIEGVLPNRIGRFNGVQKQLADCSRDRSNDTIAIGIDPDQNGRRRLSWLTPMLQ